jgi:anti-sigma B factor antagonist
MEARQSQSFGIDVEDDGPSIVVRLSGELDAHATGDLDRIMDDVAARRPTMVVLDVEQVSFIDSSGLRSLMRAHGAVLGGERLQLRSPQPGTLRLLDITGLNGQFAIV